MQGISDKNMLRGVTRYRRRHHQVTRPSREFEASLSTMYALLSRTRRRPRHYRKVLDSPGMHWNGDFYGLGAQVWTRPQWWNTTPNAPMRRSILTRLITLDPFPWYAHLIHARSTYHASTSHRGSPAVKIFAHAPFSFLVPHHRQRTITNALCW
ncbi:hypothetical protein BC628DRAFT_695879 [Trametes gibbosa]|nr:hypothetical protein BC628DRAFT_695879 [Trametes gibbosa]